MDDAAPPVASGGSSRFGQPSVSMSVSYEAERCNLAVEPPQTSMWTQQRDAYADAIGILAAADFPHATSRRDGAAGSRYECNA